MTSTKKPGSSRALRFYSEVLGLERLNYGLWEPGDKLTFEKLKTAQQRYEDHLVELVPEGSQRVLDVGCGTGAMSVRLVRDGFEVEGLSPDPAQQASFAEKTDAPFHLVRFQEFEPGEPFDCLIMSESAQYIPIDRVFPTAGRCLTEGGHLIVCDYFTLPGASGAQAKSGHDLEAFRAAALSGGFELVDERDITEETVPTLDMAADFVRRAEIALELATEKVRERKPLRYKLGMSLLRKPLHKLDKQRPLIDSSEFRRNKRYMTFLFRRQPS